MLKCLGWDREVTELHCTHDKNCGCSQVPTIWLFTWIVEEEKWLWTNKRTADFVSSLKVIFLPGFLSKETWVIPSIPMEDRSLLRLTLLICFNCRKNQLPSNEVCCSCCYLDYWQCPFPLLQTFLKIMSEWPNWDAHNFLGLLVFLVSNFPFYRKMVPC